MTSSWCLYNFVRLLSACITSVIYGKLSNMSYSKNCPWVWIAILIPRFLGEQSNVNRVHNSYGVLYATHGKLLLKTTTIIKSTRWPLLVDLFVTNYSDVIMGAMASVITSLAIAYSSVYSDADQTLHQSSASLAFMREIHRWPVNCSHKGPVTRKCFHLMTSSWQKNQWQNN